MITVIGLGFVGLTTALGFSEKGYVVYGYDIDENKTDLLKKGMLPFFEASLDDRLRFHLNKNFIIANQLVDAVNKSKIIFICVGTPQQKDGSADLQFIYDAVEQTVKSISSQEYKVLVIKSTVPPATTQNCIGPFIESMGFKLNKQIGLVNNPEFLREGSAWNDFINPDRIVIGEKDDQSGSAVEQLYSCFNAPIYRVSLNTAEYIKYLSNTLLATLISFSNEQSMIAKSIGNIDIRRAFQALHLDKRWYGSPAGMSSYVYPGCGFGGYCLPKDLKALIHMAGEYAYSPSLLISTLEVNKKIKEHVVEEVTSKVSKDDYIGILGLAFKPNSDDSRDTPSKDIIESLLKKGYNKIVAYDPAAMVTFQERYQFDIEYSSDLPSLVAKVKYIVVLTAWEEFNKNKELIKQKQVYDGRYMLSE